MQRYKIFSDATADIRKAKNFYAILEIFRKLGLVEEDFNQDSIEQYTAMEKAVKRFIENNPSCVELYDFSIAYNKFTIDHKIREAIEKDYPQLKEIERKASQISIESVKCTIEQSGDALKQKLIDEETLQKAKVVNNNYKELKKKWDIGGSELHYMREALSKLVVQYCDDDLAKKGWEVISCLKNFDNIGNDNPISNKYKDGEVLSNNDVKTILKIAKDHIHEIEDDYPEAVALYNGIYQNRRDLEDIGSALLSKTSDALNEASGITAEEAKDWAQKNVYFDKNVESKLQASKYPKEQLLADIAEFYRYVGGKLGAVQFIPTQAERVFAKDDKMQISVNNKFGKDALFHECGHLVEHIDKTVLKCSQNFIAKRATDPEDSLNKIDREHCGIYRSNERGYPDNFIKPYVGKIYPDASEVFSEAMQQMSHPVSFIQFAVEDREHFNLFLGDCLHKNPEIAKQTQCIQQKMKTSNQEQIISEERKKAFLKAIDKAIGNKNKFFQALQQNDGVDGYFIEEYWDGKNFYLYEPSTNKHDPLKGNKQITIDKRKPILEIAYLHIMNHRHAFPEYLEEYPQHVSDNLSPYRDPPEWFNPETGLPRLVL